LEDALVAVIFRKQKAWNSSIPSQVWAREWWNNGMLILKGSFLFINFPVKMSFANPSR